MGWDQTRVVPSATRIDHKSCKNPLFTTGEVEVAPFPARRVKARSASTDPCRVEAAAAARRSAPPSPSRPTPPWTYTHPVEATQTAA